MKGLVVSFCFFFKGFEFRPYLLNDRLECKKGIIKPYYENKSKKLLMGRLHLLANKNGPRIYLANKVLSRRSRSPSSSAG